jgi:DNA-binding NarL/FixJ family response regulator
MVEKRLGTAACAHARGKVQRPPFRWLSDVSMSSAFADPLAGPTLASRERHTAVVMADASARAVVDAILAGAVPLGAGPVALRGVDQLAGDPPDAVVLVADCGAPGGGAALRRIAKDVPTARVVVVGREDRRGMAARQALNAGADAFVPTTEVGEALAPALDAVMAGLVCAPRAVRRLVAKPTFSHREKEVLGLLVDGLTNRQIAARLYLAESTVKTHLATAFAKLGVRSRKDAVSVLLDPAEGLAPVSLAPSHAQDRLS